MGSNRKYHKYLDVIRVFFCLAIFLYHLGILKGGYLAVCSFFALSGYLSCISAIKKDKFSIKEFYISRLKKVYLPLIIVVFLSVGTISFFNNINWLNLKPETTSVILGYNNFWQLSVNLDYFAHHIDSPFMHLWYVSILLQFELVFPFIFIILKKIGNKINKRLPILITFILSIISFIYFCYMSLHNNLMVAYYNSFARCFSILFGMMVGFIHGYYKPIGTNRFKNKEKQVILFYLVLLFILFVIVVPSGKLFEIGMILSTLFTLRLIDYSLVIKDDVITTRTRLINYLSNISYEVFLIQYPVIYISQYINMLCFIKYILIIILTISISAIIHYLLKFRKNKRVLKLIIGILVIAFCFYGEYVYYNTLDHTQEMKQLEEELAKQATDISARQEEYQKEYEEAAKQLEESLKNLDSSKENLDSVIGNLPIVGVGDSVMLGAVDSLYDLFPKGYFDAKISRTAYAAIDILNDLKNNNLLGDYVVLHLGTNGDSSTKTKDEILNILGDRDIFWVTVTNDEEVHFNDKIKDYASNYDNVHVIDWYTESLGHSEYFYADGIHLTTKGRKAYAEVVYNAIYNTVLEKLEKEESDLINEHENMSKNKITFYGNDLLVNDFSNLSNSFSNAIFNIKEGYSYDELIKDLNSSISNNSLTNTLVFAFDSSVDINYDKLLELCNGKKVYIVTMKKLDLSNATIIDLSSELSSNSSYLMSDGIHLSDSGNKLLNKLLVDNIK